MKHLPTRNAEFAALSALKTSVGSSLLGFHFDRGLTGSVTVHFKGRVLGAWWYEEGIYKFAQIAGQPACVSAPTPAAVVSKTVAMAAHV